MRARYLLLVLLGMAMGGWAKSGWSSGSPAGKEVQSLRHDLTMLTADKRFDLRPDTATDREARRRELCALRQTCWDLEDRCRKALQANPDTLVHQYLLMEARMFSDEAANVLLWHDLDALPEKKVEVGLEWTFDVEEQMTWARQRANIAGGSGPFKDNEPPHMNGTVGIGLDCVMALQW